MFNRVLRKILKTWLWDQTICDGFWLLLHWNNFFKSNVNGKKSIRVKHCLSRLLCTPWPHASCHNMFSSPSHQSSWHIMNNVLISAGGRIPTGPLLLCSRPLSHAANDKWRQRHEQKIRANQIVGHYSKMWMKSFCILTWSRTSGVLTWVPRSCSRHNFRFISL